MLGFAFFLGGCVGQGRSRSHEDEPGTFYDSSVGVYVIDGDTPVLSHEEVRKYRSAKAKSAPPETTDPAELAIAIVNNVQSRWSDTEKLDLSYCVSTAFAAQYDEAVNSMRKATESWEDATNVKFLHRVEDDSTCSAACAGVRFVVRPVQGMPYYARAFFPHFPRDKRAISIDTTAFSVPFSYGLAGILRHEVGHVLGFRHEHTRPEAGRCFEDEEWQALTQYDPRSVMNYVQCAGDNRAQELSPLDEIGAALVYGAPRR